MTREEALKFFLIEDEEDAEDAYEEQLFEQKKFFLSKAPISKLFESRISRLQKIGDAYLLLNGNISTSAFSVLPEIEFPTIHATYLAFQKAKNGLKGLISNSDSAFDIAALARMLVQLETANASVWNTALDDEEGVIISKEPDPMYLLEAIKAYQLHGGETFLQLKNLENNPPEILVQEMKRLSLLFKKYQ